MITIIAQYIVHYYAHPNWPLPVERPPKSANQCLKPSNRQDTNYQKRKTNGKKYGQDNKQKRKPRYHQQLKQQQGSKKIQSVIWHRLTFWSIVQEIRNGKRERDIKRKRRRNFIKFVSLLSTGNQREEMWQLQVHPILGCTFSSCVAFRYFFLFMLL